MPPVVLALSAPSLCLTFIAGLVLASVVGPPSAPTLVPIAIGFAVGAVPAALLAWRRAHAVGVALFLLSSLSLGVLRGLTDEERTLPWSAPTQRLELRGVVDAVPRPRGSVSVVDLKLDRAPDMPTGGRVQATLPPLNNLEPGDRVLIIGSFVPTETVSPSGARLLARGIVATTAFPELVLLDEPSQVTPVARFLLSVRRTLEAAIERSLPQPQAGLASGLLVGTTSGLTDDLRQAFIASGTTHLVVVSGYNISLVAAALIAMVRGRKWLGVALPFIGLWLFTIISGASPPALRAAVMASTTLLAVRAGRSGDPLGALALACAAMLVWTPSLVLDLGFQLSALATLGLIALQPRIASLLFFLPTAVREPLAATLAAQLATLPVLASAFHQISAVAPISNVLAAPVVPIITILAALTTPLVGALPLLAPLAGLLLLGPTSYLLWVIEQTARWPHALIPAPDASGVLVVLYAGALLAWAMLPTPEGRDFLANFRARPRLAWALAALPLGGLAGTAAFVGVMDRSPTLSLSLFDAGGAHAMFGRTPSGRSILIDGGRNPATMASELGRRAQIGETGIGIAVLTTADADRLPGLVVASERLPPEVAVAPPAGQPDPLYDRWRTALGPRLLEASDPIELGVEPRLRVEITPLPPIASPTNPTQPLPTLAVRLVFGETAVLFAPLASTAGLQHLARHAEIHADVLVVPRGASRGSLDASLLARIAPRVVILPVGTGARAPKPDESVLALFGRTPLFQTDRHGSIEIRSDGLRTWVIPERGQ